MATSPLSGILSPQQIAVLQQARAALARSASISAQPAPPDAGKAVAPASQPAPRGRGQILNIVV